jgi:hypothetical protein
LSPISVSNQKRESDVLSVAVEITIAKGDNVAEHNATDVLDAENDSQKAIAEVIMGYI